MKHQHRYHLHGLTTADEADAVSQVLRRLPGVLDAAVTARPPLATLTVDKHPALADVQRAVATVGAFHVMEDGEAPQQAHHHSPAQSGGQSHSGHNHSAAPVHTSRAVSGEPPAEAQAQQHIAHGSHTGPKDQPHGGEDARMSMPGMRHSGTDHGGHDHGAMIADFLRRFWVCLMLSVPVVVLSMMFQDVAGYHLDFPGRNWLVLGLATVIYGYGGWPFLTGLVGELRRRQPGMMTLVAVAITAAYAYSVAVTLGLLVGMDFSGNWPRSSTSCCSVTGSK